MNSSRFLSAVLIASVFVLPMSLSWAGNGKASKQKKMSYSKAKSLCKEELPDAKGSLLKKCIKQKRSPRNPKV